LDKTPRPLYLQRAGFLGYNEKKRFFAVSGKERAQPDVKNVFLFFIKGGNNDD